MTRPPVWTPGLAVSYQELRGAWAVMLPRHAFPVRVPMDVNGMTGALRHLQRQAPLRLDYEINRQRGHAFEGSCREVSNG